MVTHTLNDAGGVPLSLIDENFKVIKRTHFLRTYPNPPYEFNIYDHTSFLEYEGPSSYILYIQQIQLFQKDVQIFI